MSRTENDGYYTVTSSDRILQLKSQAESIVSDEYKTYLRFTDGRWFKLYGKMRVIETFDGNLFDKIRLVIIKPYTSHGFKFCHYFYSRCVLMVSVVVLFLGFMYLL
jgi:hypothetical protein